MAMVENNGGDNNGSFSKTDWAVNKRGYKHRVIIKHLKDNLQTEYNILFKLQQPVSLREV